MPIEIERKFLVAGDAWRTGDSKRICQGYLNRDPQRTVRVRISGSQAFLTIKGTTTGASREEFEYEVPVQDAESLLKLCDGPLVEKLRHVVIYHGLSWEIDEFLGANLGLVVAEVELESEHQELEMPPWVTTEVTSDHRYFNSQLATHPYYQWRESAA